MCNLTISKFEENEVGHLRGKVLTLEDSSIPTLEPFSPVQSNDSLESFSLPQSTLIGDLKLTLLKSRLASTGVSADFAGEGVLVCSAMSASISSEADGDVTSLSDVVSVKKSSGNRVLLEGIPSEVYYKVRNEIYALYAVVGS